MATGANTANIADNSIRPTRPACGRCQQDPPAAIATIALWRYAYPVDRLIQRYKYGAQLALAQFFANEMVRAIDARGDPATVDMVDLVVPVPLAPLRLRERGFNQSAEVARRVARQIGVDYDARALERSRDTAAQAALELRDRSRNVRGAFSANAAVIGRHIALVDDVMTSGATLEELGQTALRSGALSVRNWVIARAE